MSDVNLIAACGLYCGECSKYKSAKCPGCKKNEKATWCAVKKCCAENSYTTCAECTSLKPMDCKKFNNFFAKLFAFVFRSDRNACLNSIKNLGLEAYAKDMSDKKIMTIKR